MRLLFGRSISHRYTNNTRSRHAELGSASMDSGSRCRLAGMTDSSSRHAKP